MTRHVYASSKTNTSENCISRPGYTPPSPFPFPREAPSCDAIINIITIRFDETRVTCFTRHVPSRLRRIVITRKRKGCTRKLFERITWSFDRFCSSYDILLIGKPITIVTKTEFFQYIFLQYFYYFSRRS